MYCILEMCSHSTKGRTSLVIEAGAEAEEEGARGRGRGAEAEVTGKCHCITT